MNCFKKKLSIYILMIYCCSCNQLNKENEEQNNIVSTNYSKNTRTFLKIKKDFLAQNKGIEIIKKENFSKVFWDFYDSNISPNECYTDINNDQILDYAFLIKENNTLKIVIAQSDKKKYSYWIAPFILEKITAKGVHFCIAIKPAGRTDVIKKTPESLVLKKNGFVIKNLEQDRKILYELNGKIKLFNIF